MNWYNSFNAVEAGIWAFMALAIPLRTPCAGTRQRAAIVLASISFLAFGMTDLLEIGRAGSLPLWLWGFKILCGVAILSARYTWLGWDKFRWRDREFLFGLICLSAVILLIALQEAIGTQHTIEGN